MYSNFLLIFIQVSLRLAHFSSYKKVKTIFVLGIITVLRSFYTVCRDFVRRGGCLDGRLFHGVLRLGRPLIGPQRCHPLWPRWPPLSAHFLDRFARSCDPDVHCPGLSFRLGRLCGCSPMAGSVLLPAVDVTLQSGVCSS